MKQLNETELEIMKYLWNIRKGFLKDIVDQFPDPGPAYTTISTQINRMVKKKYIGFILMGRDKQYFPKLKKADYFSVQIENMISNFFDNSSIQFASFFADNTELNEDELNEIQKLIEGKIQNKNK